jgi:hypothetical protein
VPQHLLSLKKTYRSLSSILTHKTFESEILLNSSRNSSLQQISNNQGKVTFRGIPALDGYQVVLMEPLYLRSKSGLLSVRSNQASNVTLVLHRKIKRTERSCDHKGATAKLIVGMLRFLLN